MHLKRCNTFFVLWFEHEVTAQQKATDFTSERKMKLSLQNKKMSVEVNGLVVTISHSAAQNLSVM